MSFMVGNEGPGFSGDNNYVKTLLQPTFLTSNFLC